MRKGKLLIVEKTVIKERDICFDTVTKRCVEIVKIDKTGILTWEATNRFAQPLIPDAGMSQERFVDLFIQDDITDEKFILDPIQQAYVYSSESRDHLKFFTMLSGDKIIAVVFSKDINMQGMMNKFAIVADTYGQYVAQQKNISEPAKNFKDWYFSISI